MRKITSLFLVVVTICGLMCACQQRVPEKEYDIMVAKHINCGMTNQEEDYWSSTTYELNTNGTLVRTEKYNLSGEKETTAQMSDEDIKEVISILKSIKLFVDDDSAVDGSVWDVKYYNKDGKVISDYHGYIYNYKKLQKLSEILKKSFSE